MVVFDIFFQYVVLLSNRKAFLDRVKAALDA